MKTNAFDKRTAYLVFGGAGLVIAAAYLGLSVRLPFGQLDRPGAAVFPVVVGCIFAVASLATIWEGWRMERSNPIDLPAGADCWRLLGLIGLLFGFFLVLPWLGQIVSGAIFSLFLMRLLSNLGWVRAAVYAVVLSVAVDLVFANLLRVPLPRGIFGL
jgi:putative tricarboxylic transport membrane protein